MYIIYMYTYIYIYIKILSTFLMFIVVSKVALAIIVVILIMSTKFATPGLLIIKAFKSKDYDLIVFANEVVNKT